jgi:hypothetical protein
MTRKWMSGLLVAALAAMILASCAGTPPPVLSSPVHGTSSVGPWIYGSAPESATVAPCTSVDTSIEVSTDSPNSAVYVGFARWVDGAYTSIEEHVLPAGTASVAVDVPPGCYRVSLQATERYCDGLFPLGLGCDVVLPPTYRFSFTITF